MENRSKLIELNHHLVRKLLIPNESEANSLWSIHNIHIQSNIKSKRFHYDSDIWTTLKDDSWTHVLDPSPFNKPFFIDDILYYKDAFYGVDIYRNGLVSFEIKYDLSYKPSLKLVGGVQTNKRNNDHDVVFDKKYLVESYKGDLLQVQRYVYMETFRVTTCFDIFKWSFDRSNWEEISDLGDEALFVGDNSSVSVDTSLSSTKCQSNCIYFTNDYSVHSNINNPSDMGVYNLVTRSVRRFNIDTNLFTRMGGRAPIWIVPNISIKNYK
ncbi:hypothetical protein G4B88_003507 [Cannabis sativa]|uniref:KIB1-4 beta-propeller domain-containing protein n=1 Tax=Cannabis sativa TaxID=3483 RepID=A0A7J6GV89_CANSA|nr:hypothetical protein G4B88_003507 [Cannabis sativa]